MEGLRGTTKPGRRRLARAILPPVTRAARSKLSISDFIEPGSRFADRYIIERELGRGGMGAVILVKHPQLGKQFALKVMLPELAEDERLVERFLREGRATARLTSEHVARVFDAGRHPAGFPFLVMEYLQGKSLHEVLHRGTSLDIPTAVDLLLQACEGVAHAHAAGIVHRDLKPANLFLTTKADGAPCLKVLDFGIAKEIGGASPMTATAESFGSPEYMSPEQVRAAKNVDPRSDVWSLGVVFFELLTRRVPFESASVFEVASLILSGAPHDLQALRPDAPRGLADVVARCFEKEPGRRWPDVSALAAALAPYGPPGSEARAATVAQILGTTGGALFAQVSLAKVDPLGEAATERSVPGRSTGFSSRRTLSRVALGLLVVSFGAAAFSAWAFHSSRQAPGGAGPDPHAAGTGAATAAVSLPSPPPSLAPLTATPPPATASAPVSVATTPGSAGRALVPSHATTAKPAPSASAPPHAASSAPGPTAPAPSASAPRGPGLSRHGE